ncbi:MAG TPA: F0F1 ATP synthase subunit delta [Candidatus Saccharimonadales bacterium]|jgi:F-type H+-transporting ATPase subunit delta|nr:F0F1 ATP synthase subunit delta [Candidatus Saccharimonadales bacterium]
MKISKQARRDARQLFRSCMTSGGLDENRSRQALHRVAEGKPRGYLAILSHFQRLVRLELLRRTAKVESAVPLSPQMQTQLQTDLTRQYGPGLTFMFLQNAALIGGVRIQVGGDVYDGTVQGRLEELRIKN